MNELKQMKKLLESNTSGGRRRVSQVFRDFCELTAISMRNSVDKHGQAGQDAWAQREARYLEVANDYSREEMDRFTAILGFLTVALGAGLDDILGKLYMSLDLGNEALGQFFTPFDVSALIGQITVGDDIVSTVEKHGFLTVQEPACGSGGMIIGLAAALRDRGIHYQNQIHVTATDLDVTAVHMTYIQTTLLWIPALIIHGNTLTLEQFDVWPTAAHVVGGFNQRLRLRRAIDESAQLLQAGNASTSTAD